MADDEDRSPSAGRREREEMYPEAGCVLVRIDYTSPPGEALTAVRTYDSLDAVGTIPSDTDWEGYVVYDSEGTAYSKGDL
jgi:hypothetical protein